MSDVHVRHDFYPRSPCGERRAARFTPTASRNFYPRSPCGERRDVIAAMTAAQSISIHALLAESDIDKRCKFGRDNRISIHALLAESDTPEDAKRRNSTISIHALLAESDTWARGSRVTYVEFLSTLSLRRATSVNVQGPTAKKNFYPRSPCGERPIHIRTCQYFF